MAHHIGDYIMRGELRNTRANGVHGWLQFAHDLGVHLELTGNFRGQLAGKHFKFSTPRFDQADPQQSDPLPEDIQRLVDRQIGVIGEVRLLRRRVPTIPLDDFTLLDRAGQQRCSVEKDCLYLEWFSQNGRVVAEIVDPSIEYVDDQQTDRDDPPVFEPMGDGLDSSIAETYLDLEGRAIADAEMEDGRDGDDETEMDDEADDPYGLFAPDLDQNLADALKTPDTLRDSDFDERYDEDGGEPTTRSWDEVIPGLDPAIKAMYEQWDEIFEGKKDEPVAYLFDTPLRLPPPDRVSTDQEAQPLVVAILAKLALLSVAVDVCEHYTPLQTYRLLMTEILPTAKVHPNLAASRMIQHYSTSDHCETCDAEFEAEYNARQQAETDPSAEDFDDFDEDDQDVDGSDDDELY